MTDKELRDRLAALGDTPDEVAETLRANGVHGRPFIARECPVAIYFKRFDPDFSTGLVTAGGNNQRVPLPEPVQRFIIIFDSGRDYQDLRLP